MGSDKVDYTGMLADVEAKITALESLCASLKAAQAPGALGPGVDVSVSHGIDAYVSEPVELPVGAFLRKSIPDAVKLYLSAVKKKQTVREIATALKEGGMESTATNFETVVTGTLNRLKASKEVFRFKDGWGLAEHYSESLRNRISQEHKPVRKKKAKAKKAAGIKIKKEPSDKASIPVVAQQPQGLEQRIEVVLKSNPSKTFKPFFQDSSIIFESNSSSIIKLELYRLLVAV